MLKNAAEKIRANDIYAEDREKVVMAITPYICYVPKEYRSSFALSKLVSYYDNSKVDNLKEAIRLYDSEKYNAESLATLRLIAFNTEVSAVRMKDMEECLEQMEQDIAFMK